MAVLSPNTKTFLEKTRSMGIGGQKFKKHKCILCMDMDENICIFTKATNLIDKSPKPKGCFPKKFRFLRKFSAKKAARKLKFD